MTFDNYSDCWDEYYQCIDDIEPTPKQTLAQGFPCATIGIVASPVAGLECMVYLQIVTYYVVDPWERKVSKDDRYDCLYNCCWNGSLS